MSQQEKKNWKIDHSAGRPILTLNNCSVIEAEDAAYVLELIRRDRAAPAEDVRAVVEEPVGYRVRFHKEPDHWMVTWKPLPADLNPHCEYQLLYRHPHRPVVLPERKRSPLSASDEKWNACLDAVEELNK